MLQLLQQYFGHDLSACPVAYQCLEVMSAPRFGEDIAKKSRLKKHAATAAVAAKVPFTKLVDAKHLSSGDQEEAFFELVKSLDDKVGARRVRTVDESDEDAVNLIKNRLQEWISSKGWVDSLKHADVEEVPGMMKRVHLFRGSGISVRLHLFEDPTETFIHNHQSNLFSCCLKGRYRHRMWGIGSADQCSHFAMNRSSQDGEMVQQPGRLFVQLACDHMEGCSYFIHANTPHTVLSQLDGARPVPVLTMIVKGVESMGETWVRCDSESHCAEIVQEVHVERTLSSAERLSVLERMYRLLEVDTPAPKKIRGRPRHRMKLQLLLWHGQEEELDFVLQWSVLVCDLPLRPPWYCCRTQCGTGAMWQCHGDLLMFDVYQEDPGDVTCTGKSMEVSSMTASHRHVFWPCAPLEHVKTCQ